MTDVEQTARDLTGCTCDESLFEGCSDCDCRREIVEALRAAQREAFEEAVEKVRRVAENANGMKTSGRPRNYRKGYASGCSDAVDAIRALAEDPGDVLNHEEAD